ncbi:MAG: transcriptional regulator [Alphaproteobacteria bacterium]|nr:MAG: transcriptional regulator [Alphaproteobacteria bacterium]
MGRGDHRLAEPFLRTLKDIPLFEGLDDAERQRLEASCQWRSYRAGQQVIESGSEGTEVFFIVRGAVNIINFSASRREIAFATARAGDCFGELAAIDGLPRSASAVAIDDCFLAALPSDVFVGLLKRRVEVTFRVLQGLAHMVRTSDVRIMELSTLPATQRVYAELLRMAVPDAAVPSLWVVRPLPPLREIASRVSTTRETVARSLSQLYPTGLLRRKGRNLYLMDRRRFEEIANALQSRGKE